MNAWERQRSLARTTAAWGVLSVVGGGVLALRPDPWWRAFGLQNLGWGVADLGIVAAASTVQARRMRRSTNAYAPAELERERRRLRALLLVNVVADAGYLVLGGALWRRPRAQASGTGAAILVQGGFLLVHDGYHALASST